VQVLIAKIESAPDSPHRAIVPYFVSGNGAPDPEDRSARLRVGVSMFLPMAGVPLSLAKLLEAPATTRASLGGAGASERDNGHRPEESRTGPDHRVLLPTSS